FIHQQPVNPVGYCYIVDGGIAVILYADADGFGSAQAADARNVRTYQRLDAHIILCVGKNDIIKCEAVIKIAVGDDRIGRSKSFLPIPHLETAADRLRRHRIGQCFGDINGTGQTISSEMCRVMSWECENRYPCICVAAANPYLVARQGEVCSL